MLVMALDVGAGSAGALGFAPIPAGTTSTGR